MIFGRCRQGSFPKYDGSGKNGQQKTPSYGMMRNAVGGFLSVKYRYMKQYETEILS